MKRVLLASVASVALFLILARWNGAVAVLFGIGAITALLASLYWRYAGTDPHVRK